MCPTTTEKPGWSEAFEPLPQILDTLEERKLTATFLLFAFVVLKIVMVARGDLSTALGIFETASPVTIVVGGLLSAVPLLAAALLAVFVYRSVCDRYWQLYVLSLAMLAVCFFLSPWPMTLYAAVGGAMVGGMIWERPLTSLRRSLLIYPILALASVTAFSLMVDVWLPHEAVSLSTGRPEVGYVLADSGNWISILRADERIIVRYRNQQVEGRSICHLPTSIFNESLWQLLTPPTNQWFTTTNARKCPAARQSPPNTAAAIG